MAKSSVLSVEDAWNAVSLEERLELVNSVKAKGVIASFVSFALISAAAYGFDQIWFIAAAAMSTFFVMPIFASHTWRKDRPQLILSYLAVRSVARRYAFGSGIKMLDIVLIFRGSVEEIFASREESELNKQRQVVDFDTSPETHTEVWICLLRGAVVILQERLGGARLEFISPIGPGMAIEKPTDDDSALVIKGTGSAKDRKIRLSSPYSGALYVFERKLSRLIFEVANAKDRMEQLKVQLENAR